MIFILPFIPDYYQGIKQVSLKATNEGILSNIVAVYT